MTTTTVNKLGTFSKWFSFTLLVSLAVGLPLVEPATFDFIVEDTMRRSSNYPLMEVEGNPRKQVDSDLALDELAKMKLPSSDEILGSNEAEVRAPVAAFNSEAEEDGVGPLEVVNRLEALPRDGAPSPPGGLSLINYDGVPSGIRLTPVVKVEVESNEVRTLLLSETNEVRSGNGGLANTNSTAITTSNVIGREFRE